MFGLDVFFFKQKTAYEMRISDWSSDVCSSDLLATPINPPRRNRLIDRLVAVAGDSMARVALTSQDMMGATQEWRESSAELGALEWLPTDQLPDEPQLAPTDVGPDAIPFPQCTSGSTAQPKGGRARHGHLVQHTERT